MTPISKKPRRHRFILSPYAEERFDSCPGCHGPTEERKFPLVIHVEPRNPVCINKTCRYCPRCDLIIAQKDEVEQQLSFVSAHYPGPIGPEYLVMGTLDHDDWDRSRRTALSLPELVEKVDIFQEVMGVEPPDSLEK
jgi:hypothetical protein